MDLFLLLLHYFVGIFCFHMVLIIQPILDRAWALLGRKNRKGLITLARVVLLTLTDVLF